MLAGPRVAHLLAGHETAVRAVSALLLGAIAVHGLLGLRRTAADAADTPAPRSAARAFVRFALLTLVNPTTALYFTALVAAHGADARAGATAFATGVFLASLAWQHLLAAAGAFAGARLGPTVRRSTYAAGYGLVAVLALRLALTG